MGNMYYEDNKSESKHYMPDNAQENLRYFFTVKDEIKLHVKYKINETTVDSQTGEEIVKEPIAVIFSWKKNGDNYGYPLSFHLDCYKFEERMNRFLDKNPQRQAGWA